MLVFSEALTPAVPDASRSQEYAAGDLNRDGYVTGEELGNFNGCDDCPVEKVSWHQVQEYLGKLNTRTGKRFRLPKESEWEYACRGGCQTTQAR